MELSRSLTLSIHTRTNRHCAMHHSILSMCVRACVRVHVCLHSKSTHKQHQPSAEPNKTKTGHCQLKLVRIYFVAHILFKTAHDTHAPLAPHHQSVSSRRLIYARPRACSRVCGFVRTLCVSHFPNVCLMNTNTIIRRACACLRVCDRALLTRTSIIVPVRRRA